MKSKHKFVPSQVVPMEERALLSTFPAWIFPVTTLGLSGNRVLTATTYNNAVVSPVAHAIQSFENGVITAYDNNHNTATGAPTANFYATVGIGEVGMGPTPLSYPAGTLLGQLDTTMGAIEFRLPYGGGTNPGTTGGSGLSNKTAFTTGNLVSQELLASVDNTIAATPGFVVTPGEFRVAGGKGLSVAEYMDVTLQFAAGNNIATATPTSAAALTVDMNGVRFAVVHYILPSYVQDFGPEGLVERFFGLKNK